MSHIGKLIRGLRWHKYRNAEGVYKPDIADDPNKMVEVNYYLDFVKTRDEKAVSKIFEKYILTDLSNPKDKNIKMDIIAEKLNDLKEGKQPVAEEPVTEEAPVEEEVAAEEVIDYSSLSVTELKAELDLQGIEYTSEMLKSDLIALFGG